MTIRTHAPNRLISDYELWALLDATGFAIYRLRELELAQHHLTIEQAAVLKLLQTVRRRGITVTEIKDVTLRQQNTISILINRMVGTGLVTKERRPGQRDLTIFITEEGRSLLRKIPTTCLERAFLVLPQQERRQFARSLHTLSEKARGLLAPETPSFMRYLTGDVARRPSREEDSAYNSPSDYMLWSQLNSTRFAISRLRELELARYGLTVEQASILRVLMDARRSITAKDLEDISLRQHHSVSTLVDRMKKMGLVGREKRPAERRFRVFITEKGKRLLAGITTVAIDMTFSSLKRAEKQRLASSLDSLYRRARDLLGTPFAPAASTMAED